MAGQLTIKIGDKEWFAELATTPLELVQGLGGIQGIPQRTGMLFDLSYEQPVTVTTEPMLFPLDIAFLSDALVITEVYRNVQPGYLVTSTAPARYFIEVNAGELDGVDTGSQATFELISPVSTAAASDWKTLAMSFMGFIIMGLTMVGLLRSLTEPMSAPPEQRPFP